MLSSIWMEALQGKSFCNTCVSLEILMKKFMCLFQIRVMLYFPGIMISNIRWRAFFITLYCTPGFSPEIAKVSSLSMIVRFWKKIYLEVTIYQVSVLSLLKWYSSRKTVFFDWAIHCGVNFKISWLLYRQDSWRMKHNMRILKNPQQKTMAFPAKTKTLGLANNFTYNTFLLRYS